MAVNFDKAPGSRIGVTQNFTSTTASQATAALGAQTYQVRVAVSGQATWVKVGDGTPTAATTGDGGVLMPSNTIDYFACTPGMKVALVGGTAGALVTITEMI